MVQDSPAGAVASLNKLSPIRLIVGTIDSGVMNLIRNPISPVAPRMTSTKLDNRMAPEISLILDCHTSVYSSSLTEWSLHKLAKDDKLESADWNLLAMMSWSDGHAHCGKLSMAKVGNQKSECCSLNYG